MPYTLPTARPGTPEPAGMPSVEQFELVTVLGQHRIADVDHIQRSIAGQHLAQDLGLLLEAQAGLGGGEKARDALGAIDPGRGRRQRIHPFEQRDRILHAGGVPQLDPRTIARHQAQALDMAGGAGLVGDLAEADLARQGAQQRGLAGVGMADDGHPQ